MAHPGYESIKNVEEDESDYSQEEDEEEEEEEPKVSTLELFSDLVIVVSIPVVAEPLEEADFNNFGLYFARVFYLWLAWHMITLFMNAAVKLQSQNCPVHCLFVFIWMSFILNMARSFSVNNDPEAVHYYLGLRAFEVFIYWKEIRFPHKSIELEDGSMTLSVSDDWLAAMTKYIPVMAFTFACCEFLPLSMAIYFGEGSHLYYPMVAASMVLVVISLLVGAVGGIGNSGKMLVNAFDSDHLQER